MPSMLAPTGRRGPRPDAILPAWREQAHFAKASRRPPSRGRRGVRHLSASRSSWSWRWRRGSGLACDGAPQPSGFDDLSSIRARTISGGSASRRGLARRDRAFYMDPLYPYALAASYGIFGHDLIVVRLVQAGLGVPTCGLVALVGRRLGGRPVGVAGLVLALYQPLVFEEREIEKTGLGVFLTARPWSWPRASRWPHGRGPGPAWRGYALRGNLLLLAPLGVAYFLLAPTGGARGIRWPGGGEDCWATGQKRARLHPGLPARPRARASPEPPCLGGVDRDDLAAGPELLHRQQSLRSDRRVHARPVRQPLPGHEEADFRAMAECRGGADAARGIQLWFREGLVHIASIPRSQGWCS